jgi:hypothetical protein
MAGPYTNIIIPPSGNGVSRAGFGIPVKQAIDDLHTRLTVEEALAGAWSSYVLAWTSSGTAPALGNATVVSRYRNHKKLVTVNARVTFGSTSTYGTGSYSMSLPVNALQVAVGTAYLRDTSAGSSGHFPGICVVDPAISASVVNFFNVNTTVGQTTPFTWANTDHLSFSITYEVA